MFDGHTPMVTQSAVIKTDQLSKDENGDKKSQSKKKSQKPLSPYQGLESPHPVYQTYQ